MISPFRYEINPISKMDFNDKINLRIEFDNRKDLFRFKKELDGITRCSLQQNGKTVLETN